MWVCGVWFLCVVVVARFVFYSLVDTQNLPKNTFTLVFLCICLNVILLRIIFEFKCVHLVHGCVSFNLQIFRWHVVSAFLLKKKTASKFNKYYRFPTFICEFLLDRTARVVFIECQYHVHMKYIM